MPTLSIKKNGEITLVTLKLTQLGATQQLNGNNQHTELQLENNWELVHLAQQHIATRANQKVPNTM